MRHVPAGTHLRLQLQLRGVRPPPLTTRVQVELTRVVTLPPVHFGPDLKNELKRKLIDEVEGKLLGNYGYVVFVVDLDDKDIGLGRIDEDTGFADFHVKFNAIFLRPFKQEVLDARVSVVNEVRCRYQAAPVRRPGPDACRAQHGFFAEVGPLTIFVSRYVRACTSCIRRERLRWLIPGRRTWRMTCSTGTRKRRRGGSRRTGKWF